MVRRPVPFTYQDESRNVITRFIQTRASSKKTQVLLKLRAHPSFKIVADAFDEQGYDAFDSESWDLVFQIAIADAFEAVVPPVGGDDRDPMDIIDDLISRLVPAGLVAAPKVGLKRPDEDFWASFLCLSSRKWWIVTLWMMTLTGVMTMLMTV